MESPESPSDHTQELFALSLLTYGIGRQIQFDEATAHGDTHLLDLPTEAKPLLIDSLAELALRILENSQTVATPEPLESLALVKGIMASFTTTASEPGEAQNADSITFGATYMEAFIAGDAAAIETLAKSSTYDELIEALLRLNRQLSLIESSAVNMTRIQYLGVLLQLGAGQAVNLMAETATPHQD